VGERPPGSPGAPSSFAGIYEFASPRATDAGNPALAGAVLNFYWSEIEPSQGTFDWAKIDDAMAPWLAAHKKVILRVATAGQAVWSAQAANGTPDWVYAGGATSVRETDGAVIPVYWGPAYLTYYKAFVTAFAKRYDGGPGIAFIEDGIGDGGETLPDTYTADPDRYSLWASAGYSDQLWLVTVEALIGDYTSRFHKTPTVPLVDSTFLGPNGWHYYKDLLAWLETPGGTSWLQDDGLTAASGLPLPADWARAPARVAEQLEPVTGTGASLAGECKNAVVTLGVTYLLVYTADIDNPALRSELAYCASL
jgi:hypothetical protein